MITQTDITRGGAHPGYVWRCRKCNKSKDEGAVPRFKRSPTRPEAWCEECSREYNRITMHNRRAKLHGEPQVTTFAEIAPANKKRLETLSKRWYKFALRDEAQAAKCEHYAPHIAFSLRDRAENWRGLAREARRGEIA